MCVCEYRARPNLVAAPFYRSGQNDDSSQEETTPGQPNGAGFLPELTQISRLRVRHTKSWPAKLVGEARRLVERNCTVSRHLVVVVATRCLNLISHSNLLICRLSLATSCNSVANQTKAEVEYGAEEKNSRAHQ